MRLVACQRMAALMLFTVLRRRTSMVRLWCMPTRCNVCPRSTVALSEPSPLPQRHDVRLWGNESVLTGGGQRRSGLDGRKVVRDDLVLCVLWQRAEVA